MLHVFVDTSALYAVLAADDPDHERARPAWLELLDAMAGDGATATTHNGVLTETAALVQHRLGLPALRVLLDDVAPLLDTVWIDERLHREATVATLAAGQRRISLVDWTSFLVMRDQALTLAFAYDDDFRTQGFELFG
jgi:predicted nucleic acid-binding protein